MSRSLSNLARIALIVIAIVLEAIVVYLLIASPPANLAALIGSLGGLSALAVHVIASALLAAGFGGFIPGGTTSDRASIVMLYFVVAFVLPGAGVAGVAMLGRILGSGGKDAEGEAPFDIGNPLTRRDIGQREITPIPHLEPLAASMREFDTAEARTAVLALRHRAARPDVAAVLKRFRSDPDTELQFFAGSALDGAMERAEARVNTFSQRIADDPQDAEAHVGIAQALIDAARAATAPGDRRRLAIAAAEHIGSAREVRPGSYRLARLAGHAYMLGGDNETAAVVLGAEPETAPERLELLHRQRDWAALRAIALSDAAVRPEVADALAFWAGNRKGDAA